jgi:hypothetical protein
MSGGEFTGSLTHWHSDVELRGDCPCVNARRVSEARAGVARERRHRTEYGVRSPSRVSSSSLTRSRASFTGGGRSGVSRCSNALRVVAASSTSSACVPQPSTRVLNSLRSVAFGNRATTAAQMALGDHDVSIPCLAKINRAWSNGLMNAAFPSIRLRGKSCFPPCKLPPSSNLPQTSCLVSPELSRSNSRNKHGNTQVIIRPLQEGSRSPSSAKKSTSAPDETQRKNAHLRDESSLVSHAFQTSIGNKMDSSSPHARQGRPGRVFAIHPIARARARRVSFTGSRTP